MMRAYSNVVSTMFDLFLTIAFVVSYKYFSAQVALLVVVSLSFFALLYLLYNKKHQSINFLSHSLMVIFGGTSLFFNDLRFFQIKPTIVYLVFSLLLWLYPLWRGSNPLFDLIQSQGLTADITQLKKAHSMLILFFLFAALSNAFVSYACTIETWVAFKIVLASISFLFMLVLFSYVIKPTKISQG